MIINFKLNTCISLLGVSLLSLDSAYAQNSEPLFHLDKAQKNYSITAKLPHDGILKIHFARLNDWKSKTELMDITEKGATHYHHIADSFKSTTSQKNLFLKFPQSEPVVALQYEENNMDMHQGVYQDGAYFSLKSNMDTLRIIKDNGTYAQPITLSTDSSQTIRQVEYTFILRDMKEIEALARNREALEQIGNQIDSIVNRYLANWENPESNNKQLSIEISNNTNKKTISIVNNTTFLSNLRFNYSSGVELFMSKLAVTLDLSYAYIWKNNVKESVFVAVNLGGLYLPQFPPDRSNRYASIGLEFGVGSTLDGSLNNKTSIGLAYFIGGGNKNNPNSIKLPDMGRVYFCYPITQRISTGFDITTNFKWSKSAQRNKESIAMVGVFLKYSIL